MAAASPATLKFEILAMINNDPACSKACLAVMLVYLNRMVGEHAAVSLTYLEIETGLNRQAIIAARKCLIAMGYLEPAGNSEEGRLRFAISLDRARQANLKAQKARAWRKAKATKAENRRKALASKAKEPVFGGMKITPPKGSKASAGGYENHTPTGGMKITPNTVYKTVNALSSRGSERGGKNGFSPPPPKERPPAISNPQETVFISGFIGRHIKYVAPKRCRGFHERYPHTDIAAFLTSIDERIGQGVFPDQTEPAEFGRLIDLELREAELSAARKFYGRRFPSFTSLQTYLKRERRGAVGVG